jgi:hypothetical protein
MRADTNYKVGDSYSHRILDLYTKAERSTVERRVTAVTNTEVILDDGQVVLDSMGNVKKGEDGVKYTDYQNMPVEFYVGKKWSTRYYAYLPNGTRLTSDMDYRVVGRENITVPAGSFDCFKVEGQGVGISPNGGQTDYQITTWYAPDRVRRFVVNERLLKPRPGVRAPLVSTRTELVAFKQS